MPHDYVGLSRSAPEEIGLALVEGLRKDSRTSMFITVAPDQLVRVSVPRGPTGWKLGLKRGTDVIGSITMLILLAPMFALVALLIRMSSPGPIFFSQNRPGKGLEPFAMLKFRTMIVTDDSEKEEVMRMTNGEFCKEEDDPRITRIGRILRKWSIDELPQLINVAHGEMSLVGPRPILNCELPVFDTAIQRYRFSTRPGITGLWQVTGRSDTGSSQRLIYDLEYTENWSFLGDVSLLFRTIPAVLKCQGAR